MSRYRQEKTYGVWHQVRIEPLRRINDSKNNQKDVGSLFYYQSKRCNQTYQSKCTISTSLKDSRRWYVLLSNKNPIICQKQRPIHQTQTKTYWSKRRHIKSFITFNRMLHSRSRKYSLYCRKF